MRNSVFFCPETTKSDTLAKILRENYELQLINSLNEKITFYDTFDWRNYAKKMVLFKDEEGYKLRELYKNDILLSYPKQEEIVFLNQVEDKAFRKSLSHIKMRALLPVAKVLLKESTGNMLDDEGKIVIRFRLLDFKVLDDEAEKNINSLLFISALRGYTKDYQRVENLLMENGFSFNERFDLFEETVKATNRTPGDYSSKFDIKLNPQLRADLATKQILSDLYDTLEINEPFVLQDIDTEFLHDFRVSIRRSRSALSQIKEVFPEPVTQKFREDLAYIGRLSNKLRDLDVYELKEDEYKKLVPIEFGKGLDYVFDILKKRRKTAYLGIIRSLNSKKYLRIKNEWKQYLEKEIDTNENISPNASRPIIEVAKIRIENIYNSFLKKGKKILKKNREKDIHQLRIIGKKLRYLLEFFSSLFDQEILNACVNQMKDVQDCLGNFNDYHVQQEFLMQFMDDLDINDEHYAEILLAIGTLIGVLSEKKNQEKKKFKKIYQNFSSKANQELFQQLYK